MLMKIHFLFVYRLFYKTLTRYAGILFALGVSLTLNAQTSPSRDVSLAAQTPQRIVSLAPHATELLFEAGLGSRVVGVSESCDFPERARELPKVSSFRGTNIEAVLALKPDLVVAWPSGNKRDDLQTLERLGIRVFRSEVDTLAGITETVRTFAHWSNDALAEQRAAVAEKQIVSMRERFASRAVVKVFYQLGEGRLFTLSNKHMIGEALTLCGARNVFGTLPIPAPEVSREAIIAELPDAILLASGGALTAVKNQWASAATGSIPIAVVDGARLHRPTLRTLPAVLALCETIDQLRNKK